MSATWNAWSTDHIILTGSSGSTTVNDPTWGSWRKWLHEHQNAYPYDGPPGPTPVPVPVETEEQKAQRIIREQQYELERKEEELRRTKARLEALSLLDSILDDIQRETFAKEDWFLVIGKSGKIYRLRKGRVGNIDLLSPEGKLLKKFCIHPSPMLPNGDDLVAQKLHLEHDDEGFIEKANEHYTYGEDAPIIDISTRLPINNLRKVA